MILNTGARTDIAQYYSEWLLNRFEEGSVLVRNPLFPNKVSSYSLTPETIDLVMFCSKDYAPLLPRLHEITSRFNTYFHYTITAYGRDIEPGVPPIEQSIKTLLQLEDIVGAKRIAWRYDPVLLTEDYTIETHLQTFEYMASKLSGHIDRCIFSFVEMYKKLQVNMPELKPVSDADKYTLARGLGSIAKSYGILIQTCATEESWEQYGIHKSGCATFDLLGKANDIEFRKLKHVGMRKGCNCYVSRDIGEYETCPNGCRYCYANKDHMRAKSNMKLHDPLSPLLIGHLKPEDEVIQADQRSLLKNTDRQMSLNI